MSTSREKNKIREFALFHVTDDGDLDKNVSVKTVRYEEKNYFGV